MKTVALFRTPPPIDELGLLLLDNKKEYCKTHNYDLIHDSSKVKDKHFSWGVPERVYELLEKDYDLVLNTGAEYLFTNMPISAEQIMNNSMTEDQDIFIIGEKLHSKEGKPNPWFELETSEIKIIETVEDITLLCPIGMFIKNTEFTRNLFKTILNDMRFGKDSVFNKILPPTLDRFQLALSIYYDQLPEVRKKICMGPVKEFACLPEGTGTEYDKLRKIMRKIISHDYSDFYKGSYTTTIWCLSSGVNLPIIKSIINNNLKNVIY